MRRDRPRVAERISDRAEAIAPELVGDLHRHRRARVDRALDDRVDVLDVHEDAGARAAELLRGSRRALRKLVGEHHERVSDLELGVADLAVRCVHAHALLRAERLLVVRDRGGRIVEGQIRGSGVIPVGNRLHCHGSSPPFRVW